MSIYEYQPMLAFFVIVAVVFGAVMGSFLNCAAWRIAHGESFVKGRSHCPECGHTLGALELIPVLSYVIQRGRCKACGTKLSVRYPITELVFSGITVICLLRFDLTVLCLRNYFFLCCLFVLFFTDLDDMIIPDGCHIVSIAAWVITQPFLFTGWTDTLLSVAAAFLFGGGLLGVSLVMDRVLGRDSLGGGDIKLFFVIGLYLGMIGTLFTMMLACIVGLIIHALSKGREKSREFPFGPSIAAAAAAMLLFGQPLISWYGSLI
ncbi:MAG: prepilin peptidase [Blautia sp.]|nr:prepilin peptidase [Blautia sp.]